MLCVLTTDAVVDAATLDTALRAAAATFDRLDTDWRLPVDQISVLALANNASRATSLMRAFAAGDAQRRGR